MNVDQIFIVIKLVPSISFRTHMDGRHRCPSVWRMGLGMKTCEESMRDNLKLKLASVPSLVFGRSLLGPVSDNVNSSGAVARSCSLRLLHFEDELELDERVRHVPDCAESAASVNIFFSCRFSSSSCQQITSRSRASNLMRTHFRSLRSVRDSFKSARCRGHFRRVGSTSGSG